MTSQVSVALLREGENCGYVLTISSLLGKPGPKLVTPAVQTTPVVQLVEGQEYRYEWTGPDAALYAEPVELFHPDTDSGRAGRLRTGLSVGFVEVVLHASDARIGVLELQVQSRKLQFEDEYQWMLRDIASELSELLMERFAASGLRFRQDESRDAITLYQRFEFLRALLQSGTFKAGIQEILRRPHTGWIETSHEVPLSQGVRASSATSKRLARIGFSVGASISNSAAAMRPIHQTQTEATHDTTPNRFVKYALQHWLQVLGDIENALASLPPTAPNVRGRREVSALAIELDQLLNEDLFHDVGPLTRFPGDDQVLQKREGYRELLTAYLEFELGALLSWDTPNSHSASSRDIATLYEYWAFLQLAKSVAAAGGASFDLRPLLKVDQQGLSVGISKGQERVFSGHVFRNDRAMAISLWFNRSYRAPKGSWTRTLRPDYSLTIKPDGSSRPQDTVILHFDAKYRVQFIQEMLADQSEVAGDEDVADSERRLRGEAMPEDLLKMHAYRDAIRKTAGAYVLYPGGDSEVDKEPLREYHELLPGLGAFVLRPTDDGEALGDRQLREFISQVIDHAAMRFTAHERDRYWHEHVYGTTGPEPLALTEGPPSHTSVLLAHVKNAAHWRWIKKTSSYNLRALGRIGGVAPEAAVFQSQLLVLYCPASGDIGLARFVADPELISAEVLRASGYPHPRGAEYWVTQLAWLDHAGWLRNITAAAIVQLLGRDGLAYGAPAVVSWARLAHS